MKNVVWRRKMEDRGGGLGLGYEGATLVLGSTFTREREDSLGVRSGIPYGYIEWHVESPKQS